MRVPLGVVGIIYEARPNVTADAAGLCLKSGNAAILRGGSEAIHSNQAIAACVHEGLRSAGLPEAAVQVIETTDRAAVGELITMKDYVDIIVPRGGKGLIERVSSESRIPVLKHLDGVCHVYIDDRADIDKAIRIADNAKTQRYGTCNTMETLAGAQGHRPQRAAAAGEDLSGRKASSCAAMPRSRAIVPQMKAATEEDWYTRVSRRRSWRCASWTDLDQAIDHITVYGSQHTDAIVTEDFTRARRFLREVDSSSVMVNASTRFADGFEYRAGRGDRHLHRQAACARSGRTGRPDVAQVHRARRRADPPVDFRNAPLATNNNTRSFMSNVIEVKVPDIGDFKDIPVIEVLVKPGDAVNKEDALVTLESDKATMEVPSPEAGVVKELKVKVGDKVSEGSLILLLEGAAAAKADAPAATGRGTLRRKRQRRSACTRAGRNCRRRPPPPPPPLSSRATSTPKSWCWAPVPAATPRRFARPISARERC